MRLWRGRILTGTVRNGTVLQSSGCWASQMRILLHGVTNLIKFNIPPGHSVQQLCFSFLLSRNGVLFVSETFSKQSVTIPSQKCFYSYTTRHVSAQFWPSSGIYNFLTFIFFSGLLVQCQQNENVCFQFLYYTFVHSVNQHQSVRSYVRVVEQTSTRMCTVVIVVWAIINTYF